MVQERLDSSRFLALPRPAEGHSTPYNDEAAPAHEVQGWGATPESAGARLAVYMRQLWPSAGLTRVRGLLARRGTRQVIVGSPDGGGSRGLSEEDFIFRVGCAAETSRTQQRECI